MDLIHIAPDGASVTERIASRHGEHTFEYAEELGIGSRSYRLTVATAIAVFAFGSTNAIAATWTSDLAAGLPGLALQWALIPLAAY